ncbi:MAG: MFS transporter, partial [Bradyrhizobium sp.]
MSITGTAIDIDRSGQARAATILARLDRLPGTRHVWRLITLLSLGGMFELYDLFMTAYVVPGLMKAGLLTNV